MSPYLQAINVADPPRLRVHGCARTKGLSR